MTTTTMHRALAVAALAASALLAAACGNFDITNPNQPTLDDLVQHPTKAKLAAAATGIFYQARTDIQGFIWRVGSMGREGINLSGNNQPDYQEPYFGPLSSTQFGGSEWTGRYSAIRTINVYLDAAPKAPDLSAPELAASEGFAKTLKALAFLYVIETRANLGAPVDVDRPVSEPPAPFVTEDSVYGYILGLLNDAASDLQSGGSDFPFPVPPGYSQFNTPATFIQFNRALAAKAEVLRATAGCGAACFTAALGDLQQSFLVMDPTQFALGAYFDFSTGSGDITNGLSEPLDGVTFFADTFFLTDAQKQADGVTLDQRVLDKTARTTRSSPWSIPGVGLEGTLKFTLYFTNGAPDPTAPIPIIRNEELILLKAEAELGTGDAADALSDINFIRTNSGKLPAITSGAWSAMGSAGQLAELLYNRRYSLMWEQGTRWIDARRYHLLSTIQPGVTNGQVPTRMPIPEDECTARNLPATCDPLGT